LLIAASVALAMPAAYAGDKKANKEREAARRVQILQQQFSTEKSALEKDKAELSQKVDEITKQAESARQGAAQLEHKRSSLTKELAAAKDELAALQEKLHKSETAHAELAALHKEELEKNRKQVGLLQAAVAQRGQALGGCEQKNAKLYQLNREILAQYRDKGFLDALVQVDPLTGIKSVQVENTLEEYRDKLDAQSIGGAK
jgi:chromosome segregation ATPase